MCGQLGKLYVVQCPQHEIFHDGCGECGDARNTAYCSKIGSGSGGCGNMGSGSGGSGNLDSGSITIEGIVGESGIGTSGGSIINGINSGIGGRSGMSNNDGSVLSGIISSSGGGSGMGNSGGSIMN
ncbi:loricrin-like, partial [Ruditapes philippinarum]|uniref:loricrin-like n=1 Tax=Ruditapes philippinarum TaxID=129788 RepID=UPI00295B8D57